MKGYPMGYSRNMGRATGLITFVFVVAILASPAAAQDANWVAPITDFLETLTTGLGQLGSAVLGIGIIAIGLWASWTGRMDWPRFGFALVGGILVMLGPTLVTNLFG
tara:strand:- start:709 stop:1029 length:321 start_codon:yes stop_codon:yes gene_type:complete